jgi:phage tail P2-like protein
MSLDERPVYSLVPDTWDPEGVLGHILRPTDQKLKATGDLMESLYTWLDPALCPDKALDFFSWVAGLPIWDESWTPVQKRALLSNQSALRRLRGTLYSAILAMDSLGLTYDVWRPGATYLTFSLPAVMGAGGYEIYFRLDKTHPYRSRSFIEAERVCRVFLPAGLKSVVCHRYFYLGVTRMSSPMFSA